MKNLIQKSIWGLVILAFIGCKDSDPVVSKEKSPKKQDFGTKNRQKIEDQKLTMKLYLEFKGELFPGMREVGKLFYFLSKINTEGDGGFWKLYDGDKGKKFANFEAIKDWKAIDKEKFFTNEKKIKIFGDFEKNLKDLRNKLRDKYYKDKKKTRLFLIDYTKEKISPELADTLTKYWLSLP